jgi:hypothetical protein
VIEVDSLSLLIHELLMHDHIDEGQSRYKKIRRTLSALATSGDPGAGAGGDAGGDAGGAINSTMNADEEFGPRDAATAQEEAGTPQQVFISQPTEAELAEMTEMATLGIVNDDSTGGSFTTRPNSSLPRSGGTQSPGKPLTAPTVEPPSEEAFALETHPDTIAMDTLLQSLVHDCRRILDARGAGVIDINLFVEYIFQVTCRVVYIRFRCELFGCSTASSLLCVCLLESSCGEDPLVSSAAFVAMSCPSEGHHDCCCHGGHVVVAVPDREDVFSLVTSSNRIRDASGWCRAIHSTGTRMDAFAFDRSVPLRQPTQSHR